jgi:putative transposase
MDWARMLAHVTGTVDQELLARNEYLATENRILKDQLKGRLMLSDTERAALGEIGHRLGREVLAEVATVARPDTILAWYRKLVARKFDGSQARQGPGRPRLKGEVEQLIIRMASEDRDWGYDRIAGATANLGHVISDQTVGNVLRSGAGLQALELQLFSRNPFGSLRDHAASPPPEPGPGSQATKVHHVPAN